MKKEFYKSESVSANERDYNSSKDNLKKNWLKPTITELEYSLTREGGGPGEDLIAEAGLS